MMMITLCMGLIADAASAEDSTVYELRTYTTNEGKLENLQDRFRDHTLKLFEKHGMKSIGYWIPTDRVETLTYLLQHNSKAAAELSWKAFMADPAWQKVYADSIINGRLVSNIDSTFMAATAYSPMK
ncbi:MAG: hypothetical protein ACJA2E_002302 [Arenicella sp.]|jgi:hypothetical protein